MGREIEKEMRQRYGDLKERVREKRYREERDATETCRGREVQRESERHMDREGKRWHRNT